MTQHGAHGITRHCDVCIVGGSAAGLAAGLQLGRQRRSVIVVDDGTPRNAPAAHMHGYLTRDGEAPSGLVTAGQEEVRRYGGEILHGRAESVTRLDDGRFEVTLPTGDRIVARRLLAATGLVDELPAVEGLAARWGRDVIHCPFCHGYEVRDQRVVQVVTHPMNLHTTPLWRQLTGRLTVVLHEPVEVDDAKLQVLRSGGVTVVRQPVRRLVAGTGGVEAVELADGARIEADAVAVAPRFRPRVEVLAGLGVQPVEHPSGLGRVVEVDAMGATSVAGVYAAGNLTDPGQQVLQAAAHGSRVGAMISFGLAEEDLHATARLSAHASDWDHRYGGELLWSGNPNGSLVAEVEGLEPGRALDVGAGEGGDAVWLAEHGWAVTAGDISTNALARVAAAAEQRGLRVECLHSDANGGNPFVDRVFDLVSAQYASIPRTPDDRGVHNLLRAVAPGGVLLVVSHDLEPMRAAGHSRPFDPDAYVRVEDFVRVLEREPGWTLEVCEKRPRPSGAASSHHVDDVVLRARRRTG